MEKAHQSIEEFTLEKSSPVEKELLASIKDALPRKEYAEGSLGLDFEATLSGGETIKAVENEKGEVTIIAEKNGVTIDFGDLIPPGVQFVSPKYELEQIHNQRKHWNSISPGEWCYMPLDKKILVGDARSARDLVYMLHEIGHAWEEERLFAEGKTPENIAGAIKEFKTENASAAPSAYAALASWKERGAWAKGLRVARHVKNHYDVDLLNNGTLSDVKKIVYAALLSHRIGTNYLLEHGFKFSDEDAQFLSTLYDRYQFKEERPKGLARDTRHIRKQLKDLMREASPEKEIERQILEKELI